MTKSKKGVTPSQVPKGEISYVIRTNWKARCLRLDAELQEAVCDRSAARDKIEALESRLRGMKTIIENYEKATDPKVGEIEALKDEVARLEKVISERAATIERLTAGIDQYQKDIANYVEVVDGLQSYREELKGKIAELEGLAQVAAQQYDKALNIKEAQNAAARIRHQEDGKYYRAQIEAYRRDVERIPRWLRRLFLSSHMQDGDQ